MSSRCEEDLFDSIFTVEIDEEASPQAQGLKFENCIRDASKYKRGRKVKEKRAEFGKGFILANKNYAIERFVNCRFSRSANGERWHQPEETVDLVASPAKKSISCCCTALLLNLDHNFEITESTDKNKGTYSSNLNYYCL